MTPKEKALELFDRYYEFDFNTVWVNKQRKLAKQCAIIAVNEIIEATKTEIDRPDYNGVVFDKYWQEVKIELEKL